MTHEGGAGWPSVVYSSTRRRRRRVCRKLFFKTSRALAAIVDGGFVSGLRIARRIAIREFSTRTVRGCEGAAVRARPSVAGRGGGRRDARASSRARRLVSMRPARSRREPTGWLDAAARGGANARPRGGRFELEHRRAGVPKRGEARDARVGFRAGTGVAEHTHRAEHVPFGRGREAETYPHRPARVASDVHARGRYVNVLVSRCACSGTDCRPSRYRRARVSVEAANSAHGERVRLSESELGIERFHGLFRVSRSTSVKCPIDIKIKL